MAKLSLNFNIANFPVTVQQSGAVDDEGNPITPDPSVANGIGDELVLDTANGTVLTITESA